MERQTGGASTVRGDVIYQIARGLSLDRLDPARPYRDVHVSVGAVRDGTFQHALTFATGTPDLAFAVARGELDLAAANPSSYLTMAYRGTGPFPEPLPVRAIAVMPSWDYMAFAVAERCGISSLAELRDRKYPLRVSIRRNLAHATRFVVDEALAALGYSLADLESWGGTCQYVETPSQPERLQGMQDGSIDAVFDEGIKSWGVVALKSGLRLLSLDEPVVRRFDALGWAVGAIPAGRLPGLAYDVAAAASFSGWPLYTRADLPEQVAYQMCAALDATRAQIAWDTEDPVGLADLRGGTDAAPLDVPLHPGAERYYREHGA